MEIEASYHLLKRLLGVRAKAKQDDDAKKNVAKVSGLKAEEKLMINVGSQSLAGTILNVKRDTVRLQFVKPVCANIGEKIALSRRVD